MTGMRDQFVNLLRSQVGYHEGRDPSGDWNNIQKYSPATPGLEWSQGQAWCATFECWAAHQVGLDIWPVTASCATAVQWWQDHGRFSEYPVLGGPLYMGANGGAHTETVWKYDADRVWSVGGNTNSTGGYQGDGVYEHVRPRRGAGSPFGYGVPSFPEGTIAADPKLDGTLAAEVPWTTVETDMPLTTAEIDSIALRVWSFANTKAGDQHDMRQALVNAEENSARALTGGVDLDALATKVADLLAARLKD